MRFPLASRGRATTARSAHVHSREAHLRRLLLVLVAFFLAVVTLLAWSSYSTARQGVEQRAAAVAERQATLLAFLLEGVEAGLRAHLKPLERDEPVLPGGPRRITAFAVDEQGGLSHPEVSALRPPMEEWAAALGRAAERAERAVFTRPLALESGTWSWGLLQLGESAPSLIAAPFRLDRMLLAWRQVAGLDEAFLVIVDPDARPWLLLSQVAAAGGGRETTTAGLLPVRAGKGLEGVPNSEELGKDAFLLGSSPVGEYGLTVLVGFSPQVVTALWLSDHLTPVVLMSLLLLGALVLAYSFLRKLTRTLSEREAALEALALSETRFRDFAGASSDWFWESDAAQRLTWVSRRAGEGQESAPSPLLGRSLSNLECAPAEERWQGYLDDLRNRRPFRDLVCRMRLNGKARWMKLSGKPILDEAQQFLGYRGTATDIDAQREAEQQVETLHRRLVNAFEVALDAAALFDPQDRLVLANARYKEAFFSGCPQMVEPGTPFRELPERLEAAGFSSLAALHREIQEATREVGSGGKEEVTLALSDGRWFQFWERVTRRGDYFRVFAEVTEFKRREEELRLAKESAELADRAKTEFLAVMSHELRTPLNAIIGFSDILRSELFGPLGRPRYREYAEDINRSGRHLLDIINDILDTSKAEAGRLELHEEVVALEDLAQRARAMITPRAEEARVELAVALPAGPTLQFRGDRRKLLQMLLNLLSNAVKFTPPEGRVTLSAEVTERFLVLCVTDSGAGIAEEDLDRVQEPFIQIASSLCREREGTGLGLPLARRIAELHDGQLTLESSLGHGTKVCVSIPASRLVVPKEAGLTSTG